MTSLAISLGDRILNAEVESDGRIRIEDTAFTVAVVGPGLYRVSDETRHWTVAVAGQADNRWVHVDGLVARLDVQAPGPRRQAAGSPGARGKGRAASHELSAPMPATVIRVLAEPGRPVTRGETLIVLEAMKMELSVRAPRDGVVTAVHCKAGELVQAGVNLLDLA